MQFRFPLEITIVQKTNSKRFPIFTIIKLIFIFLSYFDCQIKEHQLNLCVSMYMLCVCDGCYYGFFFLMADLKMFVFFFQFNMNLMQSVFRAVVIKSFVPHTHSKKKKQ